MILVIGATGRVGREAIAHLREGGHPVRGLSRDPSRANLGPGVELVAGSLADDASLERAFDGVEAAFVVLRGDVPSAAAAVARATRRTGVTRLAALSSSAVDHPLPHPNRDKHRRAEQVLQESGAPWTFLRPSPFHSNAASWWGRSVREEGRAGSLMGNVAHASIDPRDIAAIAVLATTHDGYQGQALTLTGEELITPERQVATLAEVLGRDITFELPTEAETIRILAGSDGDRRAVAADVRALLSPHAPWTVPTDTVSRLLGRPPRRFRAWAEEHAYAFR